jgi:hypothetical protein
MKAERASPRQLPELFSPGAAEQFTTSWRRLHAEGEHRAAESSSPRGLGVPAHRLQWSVSTPRTERGGERKSMLIKLISEAVHGLSAALRGPAAVAGGLSKLVRVGAFAVGSALAACGAYDPTLGEDGRLLGAEAEGEPGQARGEGALGQRRQALLRSTYAVTSARFDAGSVRLVDEYHEKDESHAQASLRRQRRRARTCVA